MANSNWRCSFAIAAICATIIISFVSFAAANSIIDPISVKWFEQRVDHTSYSNSDRFKQRYILSNKHWKPNGPIFFYAGNEGDIFTFANNTGFMWENAAKFNAMIIFMEHRYYGESLPYGNKSFSGMNNLGYLTVEQALADYAEFLTQFKAETPGAADSPVIVFGGSYGGMLAAWFRMKYPHVVIGALAASAPILQFPGIYNCSLYNEVVTRDFANYSPLCSDSIRASWKAIRRVGSTEQGRAWITDQFKLCHPLRNETIDKFIEFVHGAWDSMAMTDYPDSANFLQPLPAYPIKVACKYLTTPHAEDRALLRTIYSAASVFYNYTGAVRCNDIDEQGGGLGDISGWNFQACTEMVLPICANGITDMLEPAEWNFTEYSANCKKHYGVGAERSKALWLFGGNQMSGASNIIFSNGERDPWGPGGVHRSEAPSLHVIEIAGACHHEDLRFSGKHDTPQLLRAREKEISIIAEWLHSYYRAAKQ